MDFPAELIEAKRVAEVAWEKVRRAVMLPESTEAAITLDLAKREYGRMFVEYERRLAAYEKQAAE